MSGYVNPLVLVTRPEASAQDFVATLRAVSPRFIPLISPAFEFEPVATPIPEFDEAVFTSRAGVQFGPAGEGRRAWCVGTSTAAAAQKAGYNACNADGNADALVDVILAERPMGRLAHLRGASSTGDVVVKLTEGGLTCVEAIVYRKAPKSLAAEQRRLIESADTVVVPLFSAETASILGAWGLNLTQSHVVAISGDVAKAAHVLDAKAVTIAAMPNRAAMTQATARLFA